MRSRVLTAVALVTAAAAIVPASALAVTPPTLATSFTPAQIPVGGTSSLSFTITNPNASKLTNVGLSVTLPAGLVVDNPNGSSGTCGSSGVLTAASGGTSISLTGGGLAASANCVVSVNVTSNTAGSYQSNSVGASSTEGGTGTGDTQTLDVFALPTISVSSPKNNATFAFGQKVKASFTCTDGAGAPGINDCEADDFDTGASYTSGQTLDTTTPGRHTLDLLAVSLDSGQSTEEISYTVQPDNAFTTTKPTAGKHGRLSFGIKLPGAGAVSVTETTARGKKATIATATTSVKGDRTVHIVLRPSKGALKLLAALTKGKTLPAKLSVSFTPKKGVKKTTTIAGIQLKP